MSEPIPDSDVLSRMVMAPFMLDATQEQLVWPNVFAFPGGQPESLYWRAKIALADLHELGCARQRRLRPTKPSETYRGIVSAVAREVREFQNVNGHGFKLEHEPSEGIFHVHLFYKIASGTPLTKSDKNELKFALARIFRQHDRHLCEEPTGTPGHAGPSAA